MPNKPVDIVLGILVAVGVLSFVVISLVMGDAKGGAILLVYALWIGVPILFIGVPLGVLLRRMAGRQLEALLNRSDHSAAKDLLAKAFQPDRNSFVAVAAATQSTPRLPCASPL